MNEYTQANPFFRKFRRIASSHDYSLSTCGDNFYSATCQLNGVRFTAKSLMALADQMCPILQDEELTKLCSGL